MAWTAPMTAVANAVFTAAQFNTHVRDNFLETAPAKATTSGGYFVSTETNAITERLSATAFVATAQSPGSSGSFVDLTTVGPSVTVTTGTKALVLYSANAIVNNNVGALSYAVSGATTIASSFSKSAQTQTVDVTNEKITVSGFDLVTTLTPGSNTFKVQYYGSTTSVDFSDRRIVVFPF